MGPRLRPASWGYGEIRSASGRQTLHAGDTPYKGLDRTPMPPGRTFKAVLQKASARMIDDAVTQRIGQLGHLTSCLRGMQQRSPRRPS